MKSPASSIPPLPLRQSSTAALLAWTVAALACVLAWDMSGQDMPFARWFGNSQGFALQNDWFLVNIAHEGARKIAWIVAMGLSLMIWWPRGWMRKLPYARRIQLVVGALLSLVVMAVMKRISATSCPWDIADFGGVGHYVSHWAWGITDGGSGHCFPAGHASAGFAFLSGYFALRHNQPRVARLWLAAALVAGFALGLAQQMRGAHFMSHTLWTAWLCWTVSGLCDLFTTRSLAQQAPADAALPPDDLLAPD
ncbi:MULTISPECIES: phosphatase PAP2 family protein [Comamonas]|uniref:phosphatase PAP2 family protein n=1 Tax=Comamonas TaxID=283 RepID=UPI0012CE9BBF|nr:MULTISPECIES: phosphatase PAP2 family protein [Comamonas]MEB5966130.1 phosphatase PAP2 family protein [Comamonas testosteroni]MPS96859.1 phosphatase PAP2 family protein [Comamonas sp.]